MFSHRIDENLELRLPEERHADESYTLVRDNIDYLMPWLPWVKNDFSLGDTRDFIRRNLEQFAGNRGFAVNIVFEGRIAGNIGYNNIDWENRHTEIGYWIGAAFQGKGLVTRSCGALVEYAFNELQLNRVQINCAVENSRSQMVPKRLGFKEEGVLREAEWVHDHFKDLIVYGMLASDWPPAKDHNLKTNDFLRTALD